MELYLGNWSSTRVSGGFCNVALTNSGESIYGFAKAIHYARDSQCMRGRYDRLSLDVITVGNSTADQRYLTDGDTWQDSMVRCFRQNGRSLSIANAGLDGQSTIGHLRNFEHWFPQLASQPKFYLFYLGLADLYRKKANGFFDDQVLPLDRNLNKIRARSALYHEYKILFENKRSGPIPDAHHRLDFDSMAYTEKGLISDFSFHSDYIRRDFLPRLEALMTATRALGSQPIFVTQRSYNWRRLNGRVLGAANRFSLDELVEVNGVDRYVMENAIAAAILSFCKERGLVCMDARPAVGAPEDFYEWSHNTPLGAEKLGSYIAAGLLEVVK